MNSQWRSTEISSVSSDGNTKIRTKINGALDKLTFTSNICTPQGHIDFIDHVDTTAVQMILGRCQLRINTHKTELPTLPQNENTWKNTKKVGSLIGRNEDIEKRKQLSAIFF